jgi:hypothetical protein
LLVFVKCRHSKFIKELILKPYTKFEFKSNKQTRSRRRGESLPGKPCRMDLPGPTTSVGTRTDYSVGPWDYSTCAARHLMA